MTGEPAGPLNGVRVLELASLGAAPFACMMLADLGADVVRIDRPDGPDPRRPPETEVLNRNRSRIAVHLKTEDGRNTVRALAKNADVLVEGYRPGVMERLGLGPENLTAAAPHLIYARMTGWGQSGPMADRAGHDINYAGLAGALWPIGHADRPPPPALNLIADFGGGGMLLAVGVLAALVERSFSGMGQVVDAAMVDGTALQLAMVHGFRAAGTWSDDREDNLFDGAAPFYRTYTCADGRYVAVGAIEEKFWAQLLDGLATVAPDAIASLPRRDDRTTWPTISNVLAKVFQQLDRNAWIEIYQDRDACVTPVLSWSELTDHPHLVHRGTYIDAPHGGIQPTTAPRFLRTPSGPIAPPAQGHASIDDVMGAWSVPSASASSGLPNESSQG